MNRLAAFFFQLVLPVCLFFVVVLFCFVFVFFLPVALTLEDVCFWKFSVSYNGPDVCHESEILKIDHSWSRKMYNQFLAFSNGSHILQSRARSRGFYVLPLHLVFSVSLEDTETAAKINLTHVNKPAVH